VIRSLRGPAAIRGPVPHARTARAAAGPAARWQGLALGGVGGELGAGDAQQPDLGGDFGGQAGEVHSVGQGMSVSKKTGQP
jgi:hypothetical protein